MSRFDVSWLLHLITSLSLGKISKFFKHALKAYVLHYIQSPRARHILKPSEEDCYPLQSQEVVSKTNHHNFICQRSPLKHAPLNWNTLAYFQHLFLIFIPNKPTVNLGIIKITCLTVLLFGLRKHFCIHFVYRASCQIVITIIKHLKVNL